MRRISSYLLTAVGIFAFAATSQASTIVFDLNCVVGHPTPSDVVCPVPSYGTVTLDDSIGNGDLLLTVDLVGSGEKFKDLFFNYAGSAAGITAGAGTTNLVDPNDISHAPYTGKFDVGAIDSSVDPFSIILYGWNSASSNLGNSTTDGANNVNLTIANFSVLDTLGQTYLALHIQGIGGPDGCSATGPICTPGTTGPNSMNAVGSNTLGDGPTIEGHLSPNPEPGSLILLATGLLGTATKLRQRFARR